MTPCFIQRKLATGNRCFAIGYSCDGSISTSGEERADSDVDIMITLIPGTRMGLKFFAMNLELEELLHRPVDLVIEGDLMPYAEKTANRDRVLVYARA